MLSQLPTPERLLVSTNSFAVTPFTQKHISLQEWGTRPLHLQIIRLNVVLVEPIVNQEETDHLVERMACPDRQV